MDKPTVLYHASPNNNIKMFKPKIGKRPGNFDAGPVVFATDNFAFATHFLVETDSSWTSDGAINGIQYYVACDRDRFMASDKGGAIYTLPSDTFVLLKHWEWYSKSPVKPVSKKLFPSGLEAMIQSGVQVFFVDQNTFQQVKIMPAGLKILRSSQSENQKREVNFKSLG